VHFTDALPLPRSVTKTIYDIANEDPKFSTQIAYIDSVLLDSDMRRLLPLTALYAPNEQWEGKATKMQEIAKNVLKNHMFGKLYWCDELRQLAEDEIAVTSLNDKVWNITINEDNFPCFDTLEVSDKGKPLRACITQCDILARNGIVHELDTLMLFEAAETRPPSTAFAPTASAPRTPTVYQRPTTTTNAKPASAPAAASAKSGAPATFTYSFISLFLLLGFALRF
jgi:Fasciclin domain